ncbi:MAG TPA: hypothetical protein VJB99_01085 [Patescibacteria group bacterium]|nr:hypothetical protein [Patescibacteria group bacterium]
MNERQEDVLRWIVEEYVRAAEPIGSKVLCEKYAPSLSPATIRNAMAVLEEEDYVRSPHPSAGRIPTEKGYAYYLRRFVRPQRVRGADHRLSDALEHTANDEVALKQLARALVDLSGETAVAAFGSGWSYCAGVSNLFQKPECGDLELVRDLSCVLDRFDEVMEALFGLLSREPQVLLGTENPFGEEMAAVLVKHVLPNHRVGIIGLVGPLRMDYARNLGLIGEAKDVLERSSPLSGRHSFHQKSTEDDYESPTSF